MINGKQLNGLCKVLNVFQNEVRMNYPIVVDDSHVMMCEIKQTPMFGIDSEYGLDIEKILKFKIENEDFDISIENGRYILENENRTYSFLLTDAESLHKPKLPLMKPEGRIETNAKTLLKAVEKCILVSDHCIIQNGRISAENYTTKFSVVIGEDDGSGCRSLFPLDYLKKIAKVMTGNVTIHYDTDYPMKMIWNDGHYEYTVMLAPRIEEKKE